MAGGWRGSQVPRLGRDSGCGIVAFEMPVRRPGGQVEGRQGASLDFGMNLGVVPSKEEKPRSQKQIGENGHLSGRTLPVPLGLRGSPTWQGQRLPRVTGVSLGDSTMPSGDVCSAWWLVAPRSRSVPGGWTPLVSSQRPCGSPRKALPPPGSGHHPRVPLVLQASWLPQLASGKPDAAPRDQRFTACRA